MSKKVIACDVDGVLLDFDGGFRAVGQEVLGRPLVRQNNAYLMHERYDLSKQDSNRIWDEMERHPLGWSGLPMFEGAGHVLDRFRAQGFEVHLVTAIPSHVSELRLKNLKKYDLPYDGFVPVGLHGSKLVHLLRLDPLMFIDDRLSHFHGTEFIDHLIWVDRQDDQQGHQPGNHLIHIQELTDLLVHPNVSHLWYPSPVRMFKPKSA